jgi:pimeloyl-ACP methyl ester carboxylesterase
MNKRKKHHKYLNDYFTPVTSMKMNNIIKQAIPVYPDPPPNHGLSDAEGLARAYSAPNAVYVDGNKAYIAGTRSIGEAFRDWGKIARWDTTHIERYGQLTEALKNNPQVDTLIGHSLGASAVAELQRQSNNKYLARYYGAPFLNINPFDGPDPRNQTFRHPGDPVSAFDHRAVTSPSTDFRNWWWSHGFGGYDPSVIPNTYSNDFDYSEYHPKMVTNSSSEENKK